MMWQITNDCANKKKLLAYETEVDLMVVKLVAMKAVAE